MSGARHTRPLHELRRADSRAFGGKSSTLGDLIAAGIPVAPGFAVDCIETLEEVAMMLAGDFAERGGTLRYIPCLNDSRPHARVLAHIARNALETWT